MTCAVGAAWPVLAIPSLVRALKAFEIPRKGSR